MATEATGSIWRAAEFILSPGKSIKGRDWRRASSSSSRRKVEGGKCMPFEVLESRTDTRRQWGPSSMADAPHGADRSPKVQALQLHSIIAAAVDPSRLKLQAFPSHRRRAS